MIFLQEVRSGNIVSEDQSNLVVQNRARGNSPQPQPPVQLANQFRGQQLDQPITPAPLPRQPAFQQQQQQQQQQQSFPTFTARQPAPAPAAQAPAPIRQAPSVPARRPAPAAVQSRQPIGAPRQAVPSRQAAPAPQRAAPPTPASPEFLPTRPAPALPPTIAPVRRLPDPVPASPSSSGSSSAFSNFPARDSPSSRSRPIRPSGDQSARFQARPAAPEDSETDFDAPAPERQNPARVCNLFRFKIASDKFVINIIIIIFHSIISNNIIIILTLPMFCFTLNSVRMLMLLIKMSLYSFKEF